MIKIIHYVWLGNKEKPPIVKFCIESWKRFCPDFEIIEWNESNIDLEQNKYLKTAYSEKKYAFASDYIRFYILQQYGGVYLDTDVELIKDIKSLMKNGFMGFESSDLVNPGLILYSEKNNPILQEVLDYYNDFNGNEIDCKITVCNVMTDILKKYGLKLNNAFQEIAGFTIFPTEYFNPRGADCGKPNITENTYSIHHYSATWLPNSFQILMQYREKYGAKKGKIFFILRHPILALKRFFGK